VRIGAVQALKPRAMRANIGELGNFFRHLVRLSQSYHLIAAPTAILVGDADRITRPSVHAYGLARDIPEATLTVLKNIGHMPHWSAPAAVVAAIDEVARRAADRRGEAAEPRQAAE
jgi:pimeloyl-ACP methyl ester carboxylesterase